MGVFSLVLRLDVGSEEHLLPIHEGPWTPDGEMWFHAKISLLQRTAVAARQGAGGPIMPAGPAKDRGVGIGSWSRPGNEDMTDQGPGFSVTLRPEGEQQNRMRTEKKARERMGEEDGRSRQLTRVAFRLETEAKARMKQMEETLASSRLAAAVATEQVGTSMSNMTHAFSETEIKTSC